jgi:hypothetical protein
MLPSSGIDFFYPDSYFLCVVFYLDEVSELLYDEDDNGN